jgi:hypothetical protein
VKKKRVSVSTSLGFRDSLTSEREIQWVILSAIEIEAVQIVYLVVEFEVQLLGITALLLYRMPSPTALHVASRFDIAGNPHPCAFAIPLHSDCECFILNRKPVMTPNCRIK